MTRRNIGGYELRETLGSGGTATVYRAIGPEGQEVALKVLLASRALNSVARARFKSEISALKRLEHPNLVGIRASGQFEGLLWLAMEFVPGESLESRLESGPLPIQVAIGYVRDMALGLIHVHERGLLHRDLKPANVLLHEGRARLTDFGLALDTTGVDSRLTKSGLFLGTPGYWAPEQARGELKSVVDRTDVYGLGAVLYACLTGRAPVEADTFHEYLSRASFARIAPPVSLREEVPPWLSSLCMRCLSVEVRARPASVEEVLHCLIASKPGPRSALTISAIRLSGILGIILSLTALSLWGTSKSGTPKPPALKPPSTPTASLPTTPRAANSSKKPVSKSHPEPSSSSPSPCDCLAVLRAGASAYERGEYTAALHAYEKVLLHGHERAVHTRLGWLYQSGKGAKQDYALAAKHYTQAMEAGDPEGANRLGLLYREGAGVTKDSEAALAFFRKAAQAGHVSAMNNLGRLLLDRIGVEQNAREAERWFLTAASQGNEDAAANLGQLYFDGVGIERDLRRAVGWLRKEGSVYSAFYVVLGETELGEASEGRRHLRAVRARESLSPWEECLSSFLLGELSESRLLIEARNVSDPRVRLEQECEASFYAGSLRILNGELEAGVLLLEDCHSSNLTNFTEWASAAAALSRLGR